MTVLQQIKLRCPVCDTRFDSLAATVARPPGGCRSDFREERSGTHTLPYLVHVCVSCGYAGQAEQFDETVDIAPELRARVLAELSLRMPAPRAAGAPVLPLPGSEKYEAAAMVAGWQFADAGHIADLWLRAAWCCEDENDVEAERYYRRKAVWSFQQALENYDGIPADERATITYLVGELWRRIGDDRQASQWFARVPDEIVDFEAQEYILDVARRQAQEPEEWLP
jgi:uncharacterized protein